ncbi:MAG: hypothetical protein H7320_12560 [Ferruginibacter sp.]|nr:hypothetical protein [Ferruginibacter sp.]
MEGFIILFYLYNRIRIKIATIEQSDTACIDPSGPNCPPVEVSRPLTFVVKTLLVFSYPEVIAPKIPFWLKFHAKSMAIGTFIFL